MKRFRVTYTETRDITTIIEAESEQEAYDLFHEQRADGEWDEYLRYSGESTELEEINMFDFSHESKENPKEEENK